MTNMKPLEVDPVNVPKFREWFATRGGLAVWRSLNMSAPEMSWTTPRLALDGTPTPKPTWQAANEPERIITDPADVVVVVPREVKRFYVAVRMGGQGLAVKVSDGGTRRIRAAVAKAGDNAWHEFDYSTQEAVILVPGETTPFVDFK